MVSYGQGRTRNMPDSRQSASSVIRFGPFEADLGTQELHKHGVRIRLPGQSFKVLEMLLERPGTLVTREELRQALWPSDTFVDFDHGLSAAVNRLREAIGDSAEEPHYVETLLRRGYRFIGKITLSEPAPLPQPQSTTVTAGAAATTMAEATPAVIAGWKWSRIAALLLAAAACILLATLAYSRWHRPASAALNPVPFTALPGQAVGPAFSPDGAQIAFGWNGKRGSTSFDLYVKAVGSENLLRLTDHPSDSIYPAWSPDGTQIAFRRQSKSENGIYVVAATGGPERKLRDTNGPSDLGIDWSPDGKLIAYVDSPVSGGHRRLHLLSLDTLESTQIEHDEQCEEEVAPAFSRDGKQLAYGCFRPEGDYALSVVTSSGAEPRVLKTFSGFLERIAWTSDDKRLIFLESISKSVFRRSIHELTIANGSTRELPFGQRAMEIAFSPRAQRLAYTLRSGGNFNIWRADLLHPQNPPVKLIASTRTAQCPAYSPDGKHIAFCSNRGGPFEIWMTDADGTNVIQMTDLKNPSTGTPSWSPDGTKIVFDSRTAIREGQFHADLYVMDIAERVPRKLETGTEEASVPSWSRDGKWIYFIGGGGEGGDRIFRVSRQGGRAQVLTSTRGFVPQESSDGKWVCFMVIIGENMMLRRASLNPTGTEFPVDGLPTLAPASWTAIRDGIYFFPLDAFRTLSYFDFATKQVRRVLTIDGQPGFGMSVSPDGRYILYAQYDDAQVDIMLVDHFR